MAHAAKLSRLADGLITSIVGERGDNADTRQLHDRTFKGLKNTSHARTNQFDVQSKLTGLVEKFAVLNRDDLADGLQTRLEELPTKSKWLPEILSLFLELSDRPLEKTSYEDVQDASKIEDGQAELTWADIVADDPLDEDGIWDDVERGYHSSDDDLTADEAGSGDETQATSFTEDDPVALARMHVLQVDSGALDQVKDAQKNVKAASNGDAMSELTLIRETLSMLHGLPASVFNMEPATGAVAPSVDLRLETTSKRALDHALHALADIGSSLNSLRRWAKSGHTAPTVRSCRSALATELKQLSSQLAGIEQCYITPKIKSVASIIDVQTDVESLTHPLLVLARLVRTLPRSSSDASVFLLDTLYDHLCIAQLSGDDNFFGILQPMLAAGLNSYLRPIATWIAMGECDGRRDFFVFEKDTKCELGRLWHDRYALRQHADGQPAAPVFLRPFVDRVFALGKGRAFLRALAGGSDVNDDHHAPPMLSLDTGPSSFLPFSQVLTDVIEQWILDQSKDQTPLLRAAILHQHGLLQLPDTLQHIFFSKNGRRFQTFADTLFWRLDHEARWKDGFLLTELAQATLGSGEGVEAESLSVRITEHEVTTKFGSGIRKLEAVQLSYHFPWPLQNVTAQAHSDTYSKAFTLLLQTYRAKYLLRQNILGLGSFDTRTTHLPSQMQAALKLQQRLSVIVDIFNAHIAHASELLSITLRQALVQAQDIDAMATIWQAHENSVEMSLLIAEKLKPVRDAVVSLLEICERLMRVFHRFPAPSEEGADEGEDEVSEHDDVHDMQREVDRSLSFVTAGLRGIGRAGGNAALEQLAERLEWAVH